MKILRFISVASIVVTACAVNAIAQDANAESSAALPEYVVEVSRREGCLVSPISPKTKTGYVLTALPRPAKPPADIAIRPSKLFVMAKQDGEQWHIRVSIGRGEFYDAGDVEVGDFKLSLNQLAPVPGLSEFGLSPIRVGVLKIVRQQAVKPRFINLTSSVELEAMEVMALPDPFKLTLKNNAAQDLIAIQYNSFGSTGLLEIKWLSPGLLEPLIKVGESYKLETSSEDNSCGDEEGYHPNQNRRIDLVSAVFADGTYEGEPALAALIKGKALGNRKNLERVAGTLNYITDAAELSLHLNSLQEGMNEETDPYLADTLRSMLPALPANSIDGLISFIRAGMHEVKVNLQRDAQHLQVLSKRNNAALSKQWVERIKTKYSRWWTAAENMTSR